jgi:hypothetical protein
VKRQRSKTNGGWSQSAELFGKKTSDRAASNVLEQVAKSMELNALHPRDHRRSEPLRDELGVTADLTAVPAQESLDPRVIPLHIAGCTEHADQVAFSGEFMTSAFASVSGKEC